MWFTANLAIDSGKPLPDDESSCWIRPRREKPPICRYCSAASTACCCSGVYCGAAGAAGLAVVAAGLGACDEATGPGELPAAALSFPELAAVAMMPITTIALAIARIVFLTRCRFLGGGCDGPKPGGGPCWY